MKIDFIPIWHYQLNLIQTQLNLKIILKPLKKFFSPFCHCKHIVELLNAKILALLFTLFTQNLGLIIMTNKYEVEIHKIIIQVSVCQITAIKNVILESEQTWENMIFRQKIGTKYKSKNTFLQL